MPSYELTATGNDWYYLRPTQVEKVGSFAEILDETLAKEYIHILAGEPGAKFEAAMGQTRITSATNPSQAAIRMHRTHLPLLGGGRGSNTSLATAPASRLSSAWLKELRVYQVDAANWARSRIGCILAHDLGLGKTRTGLAAAGYPALVLCPKTAVSVWEDECTYAGLKSRRLEGRPRSYDEAREVLSEEPSIDVWILNYHIGEAWLPYFSQRAGLLHLHTVIADEAHYLQKVRLRWTRALLGVSRERCILLTATPLRNRLRSLWSLLNVACPGAFGGYAEFRKAYCGAYEGPYGLIDGEPTVDALDRLQLRLGEVLQKLTRADVGHDVPPLRRRTHYVEIPAAERAAILEESARAQKEIKAGKTVAWLTEMRQHFGLIKTEDAVQLTIEHLPKWRRAVLWVWHDAVASVLQQRLHELLPDVPIDCILGKTQQRKRDSIAREWKAAQGELPIEQQPRILIASIGAASTAVSFTRCGLSIVVELDWAPLQLQQLEKRTHRFGQVHPECLTFYCVLRNTVDEMVADVLLTKARECESVLGEDGQVDQMQALFGVQAKIYEESEADFLQRIARRVISVAGEGA